MQHDMFKPLIITLGSFFAMSEEALQILNSKATTILTILLGIWWSFKILEFVCKKGVWLFNFIKDRKKCE